MVDGTVRKLGSRLKIFTEMLDARTGEVRWAQTYEREMKDVFVLESEIAESLARVLQMTLAPPTSRTLVRGAPNMEAYLLYLQGENAWNRMSADGYRTAAEIPRTHNVVVSLVCFGLRWTCRRLRALGVLGMCATPRSGQGPPAHCTDQQRKRPDDKTDLSVKTISRHCRTSFKIWIYELLFAQKGA